MTGLTEAGGMQQIYTSSTSFHSLQPTTFPCFSSDPRRIFADRPGGGRVQASQVYSPGIRIIFCESSDLHLTYLVLFMGE